MRRSQFPVALALALAMTLGAPAARAAEPAKTPASAPLSAQDVKQWQLANGLRVLFLAEHKAPVVAVQVFYHVGSKDEPADKRGLAHMFEHMMFKGSRHVRPEQHARFIDAVGGTENAFTADDLTAYHDTIPPAALDFALQLEAERMRNLLLTRKTIDSEREVVKEEHRMRLENNPVTRAFDAVLHLAYKVHPYRELAIGAPAMLDRVTPEDAQRFYDTWYQPNNATLIVVGDTDFETVRSLIDKHFGLIPQGPATRREIPAEPPQAEMRTQTLSLPARLPIVIGAYHIPAGSSDDIYALEVLQQIVSGGESSRLYQRLVRKDQSAVAAGGFAFVKEDPGLFVTFAAFLPGSDPARVQAGLREEFARLSGEKVSTDELTKARNQLAAQAVLARERVADLAKRMGSDAIVHGDPLRLFQAPARYDAVTADDVMRVARKYLVPTGYNEVTLVPAPDKAPAQGGAR